jgi:hypothetical protein
VTRREIPLFAIVFVCSLTSIPSYLFVFIGDRLSHAVDRAHRRDFTLRFRLRAPPEGKAGARAQMVGSSATVSRLADGGDQGKPHAQRMHRSRSWWGSSTDDGARINPPLLPASLSCAQQRARRLAPCRCTLALEGSTLITRASVPSPSFLPPSLLLPLSLSLSFSLSFSPPDDSTCLFVYSRVLGNTRYE